MVSDWQAINRLVAHGAARDDEEAALKALEAGTDMDDMAGSTCRRVLFGDADPSAKLAISWPRMIGQVPLHYDCLPTGRPFEEGNRYTLRYSDELLGPCSRSAYIRFSIFEPTVETRASPTRIARRHLGYLCG